MQNLTLKNQALVDLFASRMVLIDGAMGTSLQTMNLTTEDFGGEAYLGCNEHLVLTCPKAISQVHESYLKAGADIVETNTFGATELVLNEYQLGHKADAINREAVRIAQDVCKRYSTPEKPRFVAGSIGPTTKSLSVTGGISFVELADQFYQQALSLTDSGAHYLLLETAIDTLNLKAAYVGIQKAFQQLGYRIPVAVSGTIETMGTMLAGQGVEALYTSVEHMDLLYIGLNCATGPAFMRDHIRTLASLSQVPVAVVPNAGIPLADGTYPEGPKELASILADFAKEGWLNAVGGCCGTTPEHIKELYRQVCPLPIRKTKPSPSTRVSGLDPLTIENDGRPYIVGERTNVIGSRAFKELITQEKFEEAAEIARKQVKAGAHIIDVCLSNPDRDEVKDMHAFLSFAAKLVKAPFMIDSQVKEVIETAFQLTQGKCILNSVNLEDGEKSFEELLPLVKKYGAGIVVGCIEKNMAVSATEKLRVATLSYDLLTQKYGIPEEDIYFDPLVFPCGTGDENYFGSGKETIEGIRLIKEKYPRCKTVLGISNISFGLPGAGREVLNSVFVYHCTKAGLDLAIVNSEKWVRFASISEEEKELCDNLLWYKTEPGDPIVRFTAHFREKKAIVQETVDLSSLPVEKRIEINIVQGTKENLIQNLDDALKQWSPLGVINGPLMAAMDIVGKMFNENELIVAEVLQSAEVMKAAVNYLEPLMEKTDINSRGTMLLATVKGDVHDIGKNLVQIILGNNGYNMIDLGIKCPPEVLIEAYKTHQPTLIGLSGLLVKSAQQMVLTAQDLKAAGISIPILVGGAALTESFTRTKIAPEYEGPVVYCRDAMTGLAVANQLSDPSKKEGFLVRHKAAAAALEAAPPTPERGQSKRIFKDKLVFDYTQSKAKAPHFNRTVIEGPLTEIWDCMNLQMLLGNHLGLKGNIKNLIAKQDPKTMKLVTLMDTLKQRILSEKLLTAKAVYQFFKVRSEGNTLHILTPEETQTLMSFDFPRQTEGLNLCLTDFVTPNAVDTVCFFVLTCGDGVADLAKKLLQDGDYFQSHALSSLALESAEGFSEWLHKQIRAQWGIPDDPNLNMDDVFKLKYQGIRVSFGYPACPNLEDQEKLFELLKPSDIGMTLSEEYMMYPEASVSSLVFHHPQARYFTV